jgi:hypothetical protein
LLDQIWSPINAVLSSSTAFFGEIRSISFFPYAIVKEQPASCGKSV